MSNYRNYGSWNKSSTGSGYSSGITKNVASKYNTSYSQPRIEITKPEDKSSSRLTGKYGSAYSSSYQPSTAASKDTGRSNLGSSRGQLDKVSSHTPVSYMARTGAISRETSPGDKSTRSTSYGYNRLYPGSYSNARSVSRERAEPSSTIPKLTTSIAKDSIPKYTGLTSKSSREDLSSGQKYITSRFLPKNTVQKSFTAYSRPSTIRVNETCRKNRELLNVINAQQEQERNSRPVSRCSSVATECNSKASDPSIDSSTSADVEEMESVTVITRSTSPIQQTQLPKTSRRVEMARLVEKVITRPKRRNETADKEIQSDRLDDTAKFSRYGSSSTRTSATPWSSFLDMKFSSPDNKQKETPPDEQECLKRDSDSNDAGRRSREGTTSPRNSLTNLTRSISKLSVKSKESKSKENSSNSKPKSKTPSSPQASDKKHLPPQIPKADSKPASPQSTGAPNKDFRKSVLNMNHDGKLKKGAKRSSSVSSADSGSEAHNSEITDVSENLTTCGSYHKSNSSSKLPQRMARSPSSDNSCSSSVTNSGSDDDNKSRKAAGNKLGKRMSAASSRTSINLSSADDLSIEKSQKPPLSPRIKDGRSETEAKSFLMRALAPVTSLFKVKHQDSDEKSNWLDSPESAENAANHSIQNQSTSEDRPPRRALPRMDSGERDWWLDKKSDASEMKPTKITPEEKIIQKTIRHVESGESPWWLDESAEVPEGVEVCDDHGRVYYKIRKDDSSSKPWWLDSEENTPEGTKITSENQTTESDYFQNYHIRHIDSGERAWWLSSAENVNEDTSKNNVDEVKSAHPIRNQDVEEKSWWMDKDENESDNEVMVLGDRASPEGLETPRDPEMYGRLSPYDNVPMRKKPSLFISKHTNIDDILGGTSQLLSPLMDKIFRYQREECVEIDPGQVKIHDSTPQRGIIQPGRLDNISGFPKTSTTYSGKLDDAALQLYKDGDYGSYLDLEASISEQAEEFEGFQSNKKNSIVLRTQLSVRVHTIIEKLLTSEGRELRRALFSLKQIFQEDKDLVHEFVQNDGLTCLIKVGSEADQNYQNYILRALGQVMLYVDGMNGVMEHNQTVQWLYTLISSKFRLVVKTALKLLLVFAEYTDSNCMLLIKAINTVDCSQGLLPWHNIMKLLKDFDSADTELLIYATTLINKVLNGIPDQDTYYDQTDALEEQDIETIIQRYMAKPGTDLDLLQQFQIYEAVLQYEDGEENAGTPIRHLDENIRKTLRTRKSIVNSTERRKSRRHSTGNTSVNGTTIRNTTIIQTNQEDDYESSSSHSSELNNLNGGYKENNKANDAGVTPALKRRRERAERQRSFMKEQQESVALLRSNGLNGHSVEETNENANYTNGLQQRLANGNFLNRNSSRSDLTPIMNAVNKLDSEENLTKQPWILSMMYGKAIDEQAPENAAEFENENNHKMVLQLKRENTVKDLTQKLANQNILNSPSEENKVNRIGDMSGLISKAMEGLAKSKSKADVLKSPTGDNIPKIVEVKKSENELRWEELMSSLDRPLNLCDMDFTDLTTDDETDVLAPAAVTNGIPPPPPPLLNDIGPAPPPPPLSSRIIPPPAPNPPMFGSPFQKQKLSETKIPIKKNKKTVKLFWKEVRDDPISSLKLKSGLIWDELNPVTVDTQKLEHLFESRAKDLITKKQQEMNKNKEIIVLDPKRSNAINIGMTKLPPPRSIKTAILKMDATIMNREGIEKLLTMLPTEEERTKIQEAQAANPDLPLGSAEQFLLTLASISELPARLKLWAFKLDFENSEREIAEPLMDLKQGIEVLKVNKTFRGILSTLLSIGNFLNGNEVKGFQIEYLAKVPEVKDTVHKHSLLHHLCHIVMEKFPDATDLYSEIGAITRASKVDFDELAMNVQHLESDCKASWDHLKLIAKHDGSTMMKVKMSDFLADCAERIILLGIIHRRVMNRFHKFLLWLGIPMHQVSDAKQNEFCRIVSEFALEYRTTRERVLQQLEKKANHRERNKTRGKMITEIGKFRTKEDRADAELRQLLGSDISDVESMQGTLPWRRQRRESNRSLLNQPNGNLTDGDDEILECLVKSATKGPSRTAPRERKRTRHADRKSFKRSRTRENNPFGSRDSP